VGNSSGDETHSPVIHFYDEPGNVLEQAASASSDLRKAMGADASTGWRATSSNGNLAKHFA